MQYCSLQNQTTFTTTTSATKHHFRFGPVSSFFLEQYFSFSPVAYWTPTDLGGGSTSSVLSFHLFILFMGFSRQEYWSGLPFPSSVDHVLSQLSTMTHPSWVTPEAWLRASLSHPRLWAMWAFWLASCDCGFHSGIYGIIVLASFCLLDGVKRLVQASWWERLAVGNTGSWSDEQGPAQFSSVAQ